MKLLHEQTRKQNDKSDWKFLSQFCCWEKWPYHMITGSFVNSFVYITVTLIVYQINLQSTGAQVCNRSMNFERKRNIGHPQVHADKTSKILFCALNLLLWQKRNVVPMLNWAPCHEGVWESGDTSSCILNLCIMRTWVVSFVPWLFYPQAGSPIASLDAVQKKKNSLACAGV